MKQFFVPALFVLLFVTTANGQNALKKTASLYETGSIVYSCESNFDNLIKNFKTKNIANASDYVILGYSLLETITDSVIYNAYASCFAQGKAIVPIDRNTKRPPVYGSDATVLSIEPQTASPDVYEQFKKTVKMEDVVYVVSFRYKDRVYANYVVCDNETRTVRFDSFFGAIKIWVDAN